MMTFCLFVSLKSDILSILAHFPRVYRLHFVSKGRVCRAKCQTLLILYAFFLQVSWRSGDRGVEKGLIKKKGLRWALNGIKKPTPVITTDIVLKTKIHIVQQSCCWLSHTVSSSILTSNLMVSSGSYITISPVVDSMLFIPLSLSSTKFWWCKGSKNLINHQIF